MAEPYRVNDDYIFKVSDLPIALDLLELEIKMEKEKLRIKQQQKIKDREITIKEKFTSAFKFDTVADLTSEDGP